MSDIEVDDFLAHYGVKGMRWGSRKSRQSGSGPQKQGMSSATKKKIAIAAITAGALFAVNFMAKNKGVKLSDLQRGSTSVGSRVSNVTRNAPLGPTFSSRFPGSNVTRIGGAIPLGRAQAQRSLNVTGKTLIKDIPKVDGKRLITGDMQSRAASVMNRARNRPTPASIGLNTLTSNVK